MEKIPINTFEDYIDEVVLERGLNYAKSGTVINIKKSRNSITADCEGSYLYHVLLKLENDFVADYKCSCPFEYGPVCKHIAALLYILRDSLDLKMAEYEVTDSSVKKAVRNQIIDRIIKEYSREELEAIVRDWANSYRILSEELISNYKDSITKSK